MELIIVVCLFIIGNNNVLKYLIRLSNTPNYPLPELPPTIAEELAKEYQNKWVIMDRDYKVLCSAESYRDLPRVELPNRYYVLKVGSEPCWRQCTLSRRFSV